MKSQKAIVRITRKLSKIIFAVLKNETEYVTYLPDGYMTNGLLDNFTEPLIFSTDEPNATSHFSLLRSNLIF